MKINEIFCSIQGEGYYTGTPSVFIRTSGCNLHCSFCDTQHQNGCKISVDDIVREALSYVPRHAVITGGEPSIQPELDALVTALHHEGFFVQIETNGTRSLPANIDWVTCSPKVIEQTVILQPHELKVVFDGQNMLAYDCFHAQHYSLQPCDTGDIENNQKILAQTIDYVLNHPQWHLSLQTHKLIGVK